MKLPRTSDSIKLDHLIVAEMFQNTHSPAGPQLLKELGNFSEIKKENLSTRSKC